MKNKDSDNLISYLTDGKVTTIAFGGDIPELGFKAQEFLDHYKKYEDPVLKKYYRDKSNAARKANGLEPF